MKKATTIIFAALAIAACSKNRNNDPIANIREAAKDKDLQGMFVSDCYVKPLDAILTGILTGGNAAIKAARTAYLIQGANITRTTRLFNSADCSGDAAFTFEELGDMKIDKDQKTNDGGYFIDVDYKSLHVKMATQVGVQAANATKLCGMADWATGQDRDVTGVAKDMTCYGAQIPRHNANIYRVDSNVLYFGTQTKAGNDGSTRPTTLDMATRYTEQK